MKSRESVADIGVFGGSGFYSLLEDPIERTLNTPYGHTSDRVSVGEIGGKRVAFMPRHGVGHKVPAHRVNYRANVWAMWSVGVSRLLGPCAAGSLQRHVRPGDFVVCDQFVDRTRARGDTFYDGPLSVHISSADPYCPELRPLAVKAAQSAGITAHNRGTVVVIQGPRFSTRAESKWFSGLGWQVINMTQYPECILPRELEICYLNISLITDFDVGLEGHPDVEPVTNEEVLRVFSQNVGRVRQLIVAMIPRLAATRACDCVRAMQHALML